VDDPRLDQIFADLLHAPNGTDSLPQRFCRACVEALSVTAAVLTLVVTPGQYVVVGATDSWARRLEEIAFTLGEGAPVDATTESGPVLVPDLHDRRRTSRWPTFRPAVASAPLRGQFCFPLQIGTIRLGVLTLYREQPGPLLEEDLVEALTYADAATLLLLHLQDVHDGDGLPADIGREFELSAEIHQATGMVSVQAGVSIQQALLLLRARAFSSERSLADVATDVVQRRLRFSTEDS
jgi:GAF domain-containing protein